jgi:hypothetical protein
VKIKRVWMFERAVFLSKTKLLLIAMPQIRHCRLRSTRCFPNVKNIKICFVFSEWIQFFLKKTEF